MTRFIIIFGNVVDGLTFIGTFDTASDAVEWASENWSGEWAVAPLDLAVQA